MTDGFSAVQSCYRLVDSYEEMMAYLVRGRADELLASLEKQSREDPTFNRFPRLKLMDDASVIVARNTIRSEGQFVVALSPRFKVSTNHPKSIIQAKKLL